MSILVAYYSRTDITKKVADEIAGRLNADSEEIISEVKYDGKIGYARAGKDGIQYVGQSVYAAIQKSGWRNISTEILEIRDCDEDTAAAIEEGYIDEYQSNNPHFGYNSPSAPRYHNGSKPLSPESCKKIGLSKVGRIWCYKDDDLRFATPDEWAILEQDGYKKGFTEKTITRKRNSLLSLISVRNSEGTLKRVRSSELDNYLNSGWILEKDYQQQKSSA